MNPARRLNAFHGHVIDISDIINFKGKSMAERKREFAKSIETISSFAKTREMSLKDLFQADSFCASIQKYTAQ